ncbi:MAG TPA: RNA polymerase sigma factor [Steroidobacteraceae bacterium]
MSTGSGEFLVDSGQAELAPVDTQASQRKALTELYRTHRDSLLRALTRRCRTRDEAEEVLHEALAKLFALDRPGTCSFLSSLLYRTAVNLVMDRRKQEVTRARLNSIALTGPESFAPSPEETLRDHQFAELFAKALDQLQADAPKWAEAFLLRTQHELMWEEVGHRMGVGTRMAQLYVARAVEYCHDYLEGSIPRRALR